MRTLTRARRVLGDESHFTIDIANTLATALLAVGEVEAARQLSEDTLAQARRAFGEDHPRTLKAAHNLATTRRLLPGEESVGLLAPSAARRSRVDHEPEPVALLCVPPYPEGTE